MRQGSWKHPSNPSELSLHRREPALEANYPSHEGGDRFPEAESRAPRCTSAPPARGAAGSRSTPRAGSDPGPSRAASPPSAAAKIQAGGWVEVTARISSLLPSFTLEQKPGSLSSSPLGTASGAHAAGADERCSQIYFFLACLRWCLLAAWLLLQPGYGTPSTRSATRRGRSAGFG